MCSHSSPDRERRTVPLKRSTADSSIYAGPRWDSATSRITSRGVCSSPVASDRFYTLNYDEPLKTLFNIRLFIQTHRKLEQQKRYGSGRQRHKTSHFLR